MPSFDLDLLSFEISTELEPPAAAYRHHHHHYDALFASPAACHTPPSCSPPLLASELPDQALGGGSSGADANPLKRTFCASTSSPPVSKTVRLSSSSASPLSLVATEEDCKNEIRKERNRQAAEKTRMRRLENARNLQSTIVLMESFVNRLVSEPCPANLQHVLDSTSLSSPSSSSSASLSPGATSSTGPTRKVRVKKGNEAAELYKLKTNLSAEERFALQTEARKARNRASAERSRNKMLEANLDMQHRIALLKLQAINLLQARGQAFAQVKEEWIATSDECTQLAQFACSEQE
ncbi:hypothetical protein BASA81_006712 [Batrachochytrium salamandrivorans]|nr:hypothetical protein BASA81_006712 [Batrachochytrium salamandrivorans]